MTEKEFYESIRDQILDYLPEEYEGSKVEVHEVMKNNDTKLTGITVVKKDENAAPIIYLNRPYEGYQNGQSMEDICAQLSEVIQSYEGLDAPLRNLDLKYDSVKDDLRVKLVNNKTNHKLLKESVNMPVGCGYSFVPYIDLKMDGLDGAMIRITHELAAKFGCSEDQIIEDAVKGSEEHDGAKLCRIEDVLFADSPDDLLGTDNSYETFTTPLVLTNDSGVLGASVLFLPGMQQKISESIGGGYYVLPSSVHEMLIMPDSAGMGPSDLVRMVRDVNHTMVDPEEQLGSKVLRYDPEINHMSIAADLDKARSRVAER